MKWLAQTVEVARQSSIRLSRSWFTALLLVAALVVAGILAVVAGRGAEELSGPEFFGITTYLIYFQFGMPFVILYLGVLAVHGDIADRTVTYMFVRPLRRSSIVIGKWLAVVAVGWAVSALAIALVFVAVSWPERSWVRGLAPSAGMLGDLVLAAGMAACAYGAVGVCFGAYFKRPLIWAAGFVIGWEVIVSMAPPQAGVRGATVADPIRRWLLEALDPSGPLRDLLVMGADAPWEAPRPAGSPVVAVARMAAILLAVALWIYGRREYDSRPRD